MKLRESGLPDQASWETFFNVPGILAALGCDATTGPVAELGCGYGTFTVPLAARIRGPVHAFDIDPAMVATTAARAAAAGLTTVQAAVRDVARDGYGLPPASCAAVLLFNILHAEDPVALLRTARTVLQPTGFVAVIHWRSDVPTPRGPPLAIRPSPAAIIAWAAAAGLIVAQGPLLLPPWHYGLTLRVAAPSPT